MERRMKESMASEQAVDNVNLQRSRREEEVSVFINRKQDWSSLPSTPYMTGNDLLKSTHQI